MDKIANYDKYNCIVEYKLQFMNSKYQRSLQPTIKYDTTPNSISNLTNYKI